MDVEAGHSMSMAWLRLLLVLVGLELRKLVESGVEGVVLGVDDGGAAAGDVELVDDKI